MGKSFDSRSFVEGALKGVITQIDKRAEEAKREADLKRDVTKHILQKKADMEMQKDWLKELQSQMPQNQNFVRETNTPAQSMQSIFGTDVPGSRSGQVPTVATEEVNGVRRPMADQTSYDVNLGAVSGMQTPTMTSSGVSMRGASEQDKIRVLYQKLDEAKRQGKQLSPQAEYIYKGLKAKLFGGDDQQAIVDATGKTIGYRPKGSVFQPKAQSEDDEFNRMIGMSGEEDTGFTPEDDELIQANMDYYGKSREEVVAALKQAGKL
jgi:hypothetical protein